MMRVVGKSRDSRSVMGFDGVGDGSSVNCVAGWQAGNEVFPGWRLTGPLLGR